MFRQLPPDSPPLVWCPPLSAPVVGANNHHPSADAVSYTERRESGVVERLLAWEPRNEPAPPYGLGMPRADMEPLLYVDVDVEVLERSFELEFARRVRP